MPCRVCSVIFQRRAIRLGIALVALGLLAPHGWAWYQLRSAKSALARYHPDEARAALASCERVWGNRASVRLLASRAARQANDLERAAGELVTAQRILGSANEDTALEWALLQAWVGNVGEVEEYLQKAADHSPAVAGPLAWEALAIGYIRRYRTLDAMACLNIWLKRSPDNVRALELRGVTYVSGRGVVRGAEDFRRALELDPTRTLTRWSLIDATMGLGGYEEAARHLEIMAKETPDDPAVPARLARCYLLLSRGDEAERVIDEALRKYPDNGQCLRTRGQISLLRGRPAEAEVALRRAVELLPSDYQAHQLLFQSLQQQPNKVGEAKAQLKVAETVRDRTEQILDLSSRKLAEFPLDPSLHTAMGRLMIQNGQGEAGEGWLLTALELDPNYKPAHLELANYYDRTGDTARAAGHRKRAAP